MTDGCDGLYKAIKRLERAMLRARAERDGYLETIRETFRVLESRGQAPDDNAPLSVTVRRALDFLDKVTAERDGWRQVHQAALDHAEEREKHHAETVARLTAERDALAEQLAALKKRLADAPRITVFEMDGELCHSRPEPRDWRVITKPIEHGDIVAWVRLEDGE